MGNQQLSTSDAVALLARNARFGDGYLWKHPECRNYKAIWTSTTPELLELKRSIAPEVFPTGVRPATTGRGRFPNAKPLFRLASTVHEIFTEHRAMSHEMIFEEMTLLDFALWWLDDGCCIRRSDSRNSHRFVLSIGDCAYTQDREQAFRGMLGRLFPGNLGRICRNGMAGTDQNKIWIIPKPIAEVITQEAEQWGIMPTKFPR